MKKSKPHNVVQVTRPQKRRYIPAKIFGISEATLFDKRADKRDIGFCADVIKASLHEKEEIPAYAFERCMQRGELVALQRILKQGEACETTRFKLLTAYKAAFADGDPYVRSVTDRVDFSKPPSGLSDPSCLGWIFWSFMGPYDLAAAIREHGLKPPTLARVRRYFASLYPECKNNWPGGDASRDRVHRTTIVRMGLPLAKDKIRPAVESEDKSLIHCIS